ncbi:outer membrane protein assembly factor BamB family protein [Streptomyces apocyni]|uniref:outer membrane protein assembly factor BamB family protein n=1 Tax=Streptomyces apocyni TaxID=2654677 RepID=UPI0018D141F2|nr:PQQ-binding-like beta-propeller repeat protein [Streptomyces apocyni]
MPMQPPGPGPGPAGPGGGSGGKRFNSATTVVIAAVVAVALVVGGGVLYASKSGDDQGKTDEAKSSAGKDGGKEDTEGGGTGGKEEAPSNTSAKVLLREVTPEIPEDILWDARGAWLTGDVYAKSNDKGVAGYDLATGEEKWIIELPGPVCAASRHVNEDDLTAIVHQNKWPKKESDYADADTLCTEVTAIDLAAGKELWTHTVSGGTKKVEFEEITVSGNIAAAGGTGGGAAYDISTGKNLWKPKVTDSCADAGYGGGAQLIAIRKCGEYEDTRIEVQLLKKDGRPEWSYRLPAGLEYASVVSTDPVAVAVEDPRAAIGEASPVDVFSFDDEGELLTKLSLMDDLYEFHCEGAISVERCVAMTVGNGKLYVATTQHSGNSESGQTNEIVGFDLKTGKLSGPKADAGERGKIYPLQMDGSNVIAYRTPSYEKGGQVVSLDSRTMKETLLLENPAEGSVRQAETSFNFPDEGTEFRYGNGRLFISDDRMSDTETLPGREDYLAIGFAVD